VPKARGVKIIKDIRPISITPLQNRTDDDSGVAETLGEEPKLSLDEATIIYGAPSSFDEESTQKAWLPGLELRVGEPLQ